MPSLHPNPQSNATDDRQSHQERPGAARPRFGMGLKVAAGAAGLAAAAYFMNGYGSASRMETACASILNVVNPQGSTFERHVAGNAGANGVVRLLYGVHAPDGQQKRVIILCAFDATALTSNVPPLVAVALNGHQLGPARLAFLNRFWLHSAEAQAALPSATAATYTAKSETSASQAN